MLLTYYASISLSRSLVLTRFCTLTWVTKNLMRPISNDRAGRRLPTSDINHRQVETEASTKTTTAVLCYCANSMKRTWAAHENIKKKENPIHNVETNITRLTFTQKKGDNVTTVSTINDRWKRRNTAEQNRYV